MNYVLVFNMATAPSESRSGDFLVRAERRRLPRGMFLSIDYPDQIPISGLIFRRLHQPPQRSFRWVGISFYTLNRYLAIAYVRFLPGKRGGCLSILSAVLAFSVAQCISISLPSSRSMQLMSFEASFPASPPSELHFHVTTATIIGPYLRPAKVTRMPLPYPLFKHCSCLNHCKPRAVFATAI